MLIAHDGVLIATSRLVNKQIEQHSNTPIIMQLDSGKGGGGGGGRRVPIIAV
jgi:hypothetical protein